MLKACKHSNCAVCKEVENRDIFKYILKTLYPEVYICEHAMYKITSLEGSEIIIPTLEYICDGRQGYYIMDPYTSKYIYLNKENFEVLCSSQGECNCQPYVAKYNIEQHKKKDS